MSFVRVATISSLAIFTAAAFGQGYSASAQGYSATYSGFLFWWDSGGLGQVAATGQDGTLSSGGIDKSFASMATGTIEAESHAGFYDVISNAGLTDTWTIHSGSGTSTGTFHFSGGYKMQEGPTVPGYTPTAPIVSEGYSVNGYVGGARRYSISVSQQVTIYNGALVVQGAATTHNYATGAITSQVLTSWHGPFAFNVPVVNGEVFNISEHGLAESGSSGDDSSYAVLDPTYNLVLARGTTVSTASGVAAPTPEPCTLAVLAIPALAMLRRRKSA